MTTIASGLDNGENERSVGLPYLPSPVFIFTTKAIQYHKDNFDATAVAGLSPTYPHNFNTAHKTVMNIASKYVESVVYIDRFWVYITRLQAFFHRAADIERLTAFF
ncbi:hypothetical protein MFLAVUS_005090 [Mucor flavus]|uniref:Uncharacterized protein n=1 Tax=Mucor flavus TaxID=439312 RepID=A0ABP9YXP9_9FUNG